MNPADGIIARHAAELRQLCEEYGVRRLEIFGSATTGRFDPDRSDLDFLVEYVDDPARDPYDTYFGLLESLETLFGRKVDLVNARGIENPYFLRRVNEQRRVVYAG
jgi:predicted nucleotidyltransferase